MNYKISNTEIAYANFFNDTSHKPFIVFLDHDKEQVVISVRGTFSLEDVYTDIVCEPVELKSVSCLFELH